MAKNCPICLHPFGHWAVPIYLENYWVMAFRHRKNYMWVPKLGRKGGGSSQFGHCSNLHCFIYERASLNILILWPRLTCSSILKAQKCMKYRFTWTIIFLKLVTYDLNCIWHFIHFLPHIIIWHLLAVKGKQMWENGPKKAYLKWLLPTFYDRIKKCRKWENKTRKPGWCHMHNTSTGRKRTLS